MFNEIKTKKKKKKKKMYEINQLKHTLSLLLPWSVKLSTNQEDKTRQAHTQNMNWSRTGLFYNWRIHNDLK